ncbi:MAG: hypothetical protein JNM83_16130 [Myxococcales bacterium]|jgi:hypothetical protein|nr:hypothetical protein [Myxococcales bacterium]
MERKNFEYILPFEERNHIIDLYLCTDRVLSLPKILFSSIERLGRISNGDSPMYQLAKFRIDTSTETGLALCSMAYEIECLIEKSNRAAITANQSTQETGAALESKQTSVQHASLPRTRNSRSKFYTVQLRLTGTACVNNTSNYQIDEDIVAFSIKASEGIVVLSVEKKSSHWLLITFGALPYTLCGTQVSGKVSLDLEIATV